MPQILVGKDWIMLGSRCRSPGCCQKPVDVCIAWWMLFSFHHL